MGGPVDVSWILLTQVDLVRQTLYGSPEQLEALWNLETLLAPYWDRPYGPWASASIDKKGHAPHAWFSALISLMARSGFWGVGHRDESRDYPTA
jgi:hypothetical protein